MNMPQPDWRDPTTIDAVERWLRLVVGAAFVAILLIMLVSGKIDVEAFLKALIGVLALDKVGQGAVNYLRSRNDKT